MGSPEWGPHYAERHACLGKFFSVFIDAEKTGKYIRREIFSEFCWVELISDCNYTFPIDLA